MIKKTPKEKMFNKGPKPKRPIPICGNYNCCSSTSIADTITHGWGKLDANGFWEHACPDSRHAAQDAQLYRELKIIS